MRMMDIMRVWKCPPQSGKRVPARRARPMATPACVIMLIQKSLLVSFRVVVSTQPTQLPTKMAAIRTTDTSRAIQSMSFSADSFRLAPANPKNATLLSDMMLARMPCSSSFSFSARSCRRFTTTMPMVTHASSGSASKWCANWNTAVDTMMMTPIRVLAMPCSPPKLGTSMDLGRMTMLISRPPHTPTVTDNITLSTGSITLSMLIPSEALGRIAARISSMLSA
mmetsp:Transcript_32973/g.72901  ORF Transcript_32973/g.72901 Transcript_32973/m.72901 type:complete len:224 (+) Transcript_32973:117-788(+)